MSGGLELLDEFGFEAAAIVLGPEGVREQRGDVEQIRLWRSVTKALTGYACTIALQEGTIRLEDPAGPPGSTVRHLLSHASGYFYESAATLQPPGRRRHYSNFGIDEAGRHLGRALGRGSGQDRSLEPSRDPLENLGAWIQERIAGPLGMSRLEWTGSPSVGAAGPLCDLARLAAEVLRPTLLEPGWSAEMTSAQFPELVGIMPGFGKQSPNPFGLGVEIRGTKSPHWTGERNSAATVGHFGMRGTAFWVDPVADLALVVGTGHDFCDAHRTVMPRLADAVLAAHARSPRGSPSRRG